MRLPNLLASRRGRLTAFFFLYLTEGIPLGFVATAVATTLRRDGVGPAEIGAFVAAFYIPWSWKFIMGPIVDVFASEKLGRRRMWIVGAQTMMVATLLVTVGIDLPAQLKLFTILLLIHNCFAATQDVAIDALAVQVLKENERGLANGLMFGAAYLGQTIGGALVLKMMGAIGLQGGIVFVAACIASVTLLVALPLKEGARDSSLQVEGSGASRAFAEVWLFVKEAFRALLMNRLGFFGLIFALLPAGAMSLGGALQSNLAVEIGMTDSRIGDLAFWSTILSAFGCIVGGLLSDKLGRRKMLALYIFAMSLPVFYLSMVLKEHGFIMPVDMNDPDRVNAPQAIFQAFWISCLIYSLINGLMYGTRTALFMDVTNPLVAATQFTAYMALLNLTISYSLAWQGFFIERHGYPNTLLVDGIFGLVCILVLPFMVKKKAAGMEGPSGGRLTTASPQNVPAEPTVGTHLEDNK
ncbi:MAG: MFS transporter [Candidatus Eisenbacteria bacterium]|uniref:MFS transporter n=1 Tax=Eiseniibacteriota bacterium TaxID=2212470 RepID=A0A7Y2H3Q9_UNCEI|nr:MFS transporter [Candidatus Eisenbacteria bacterium]